MSATLVKSVRFLALLGGVALTLTWECQPLFLGVFFSFFLIGFKVERFPALSRFFGAAQPYLAVFILAVAIVDFFYLSNSFLLTVAHFLLSVHGVRLLALRTNRENFGSVLLSSLMMLSASTLSVDWTYFLMLFVFLLAVVWTLMLLTLLEENKDGITEGSLLWRDLMPVLRGATALAFAIAFLCCAVVFVLFPRFNFQGFRGQFLQPVHKTGFTSQVDLGGSGKIFEDNSIVMRVEIDPADRKEWSGYLRGRALETFNGKVWERYPSRSQQVFHQRWRKYSFGGAASKRTLRQKIYLESMDSPLLFAQSQPVRMEIDRPFLEMGTDGSLQRRAGDLWRIHYDVVSGPSNLDPGADAEFEKQAPIPRATTKAFRIDGTLRKSIDAELLSVPYPLTDVLKQLSTQWVAKSPNALAKARAIEGHLRTNYAYSLNAAPLPQDKGPLEVFLLETKRGHCEVFAASMCLMLRTQGIPARLATGFLSNEWNSRGNYYIVRMKHAHAWVEAYVEPYGWVGFDPSPRATATGPADSLAGRWAETMDYINLRWNRYILSYDFERQVEIVKSVTQGSTAISLRLGRWSGVSEKFRAFFGRVPGLSGLKLKDPAQGEKPWKGAVTTGFAVVLALTVLVLGVKSLRRRADRVWFYRIMLRRLEKRLGRKPVSQTLREYIASSQQQLGPRSAPALFLQDLYYRLRFDPAAHPTPAEAAAIPEKLRQI